MVSWQSPVGAFGLLIWGCGMQVLYALALIPAGFLADKADRPRLLAGGLGLWSVLTMVASKVIHYALLYVSKGIVEV